MGIRPFWFAQAQNGKLLCGDARNPVDTWRVSIPGGRDAFAGTAKEMKIIKNIGLIFQVLILLVLRAEGRGPSEEKKIGPIGFIGVIGIRTDCL